MALKVIANVADWRKFIRRAKTSFPIEHCEAIWGEESVDAYRITNFKKMRVVNTNTKQVYYDDAEIKRQKWLAQKAHKIFLGTVHIHPYHNSDSAPSSIDHYEGFKDGEKVMGIVVLYKTDNKFIYEVNWWFPQRKIDFELLPE
jgi:proteasome lid subunit RPN8/RPN11